MNLDPRNFLERMTHREKMMVISLFSVMVVGIILLTTISCIKTLRALETDIEDTEMAIETVRTASPTRLNERKKEDALKERLENNRIDSLKRVVNDIARKIQIESPGAAGVGGSIDGLITFPGKEIETPIALSKKKKKRRRNKELKPGNYLMRRDHEVNIREVPFQVLNRFLAALERHPELLFVTSLTISRTYKDFEFGRVKEMTVSTYELPTKEDER